MILYKKEELHDIKCTLTYEANPFKIDVEWGTTKKSAEFLV